VKLQSRPPIKAPTGFFSPEELQKLVTDLSCDPEVEDLYNATYGLMRGLKAAKRVEDFLTRRENINRAVVVYIMDNGIIRNFKVAY
jgi:hypothetical protein